MDPIVFAIGFGFGGAVGSLVSSWLIGGRYIRALEQLRDIHPESTGPVGEVSVPEPTTEQRLAQLGFDEEAVTAFAKQLMRDAEESGIPLSYDEAYAAAASSMLDGTLPENA